jgi:hypothetical protein
MPELLRLSGCGRASHGLADRIVVG